MKNLFNKISLLTALLLMPQLSFAANSSTMTLRDLIVVFVGYLNIGVYVIVALAVITFIFNVYRYFFTEKDKKEAGMYVLYSTIGFFVILSFWGLVAIITNSLNLPNNQPSWPFGAGAGTGTGSGQYPTNQFTSPAPTQNNGSYTFPQG